MLLQDPSYNVSWCCMSKKAYGRFGHLFAGFSRIECKDDPFLSIRVSDIFIIISATETSLSAGEPGKGESGPDAGG